jgi:H+/Cl- antiporter ClcA
MKKYLLALIPFAACSLLSVLFGVMEPRDYPDNSYPYGTQQFLDYYQTSWFFIGVAISASLAGIVAIEDVSSRIEKYREHRQRQRFERR